MNYDKSSNKAEVVNNFTGYRRAKTRMRFKISSFVTILDKENMMKT